MRRKRKEKTRKRRRRGRAWTVGETGSRVRHLFLCLLPVFFPHRGGVGGGVADRGRTILPGDRFTDFGGGPTVG